MTVEISGSHESNEDPYRLTVIVNNTKDFTDLELAKATAIAVNLAFPDFSSLEHDSNWRQWMNGRFGKLMKRLKPNEFRKLAETVEGFSYSEGSVNLYVVEPFRKSEMPKPVLKAQVSGLQAELDDRSEFNSESRIRITMNRDLNMSIEKASIAAAHALQILQLNSKSDLTSLFNSTSVDVVWGEIKSALIYDSVVRDAGLTEVVPGSITAAAVLVN